MHASSSDVKKVNPTIKSLEGLKTSEKQPKEERDSEKGFQKRPYFG